MKNIFRRLSSTSPALAGIALLILVVLAMLYALIEHLFINPPVDARIDHSDELVQAGDQIQLNVLNGCGEQGSARTVMDYMRARGFDVVEIANYSNFDVQRSFVIDRVGDTVCARKVAYALGIPDSLRRTDIDSSLYLRCSVVLGHDYRELKAFGD